MLVSSRSGLGAWWSPPPPPPPPPAVLPSITLKGPAVPTSPIMQVATTYAADDSLPPNIKAGGCSALLPGFYVGPGNYVYTPGGTNTGDWIDPDNQRLFSSGLPLCHAGSSYQDLGAATVLSIPDDLRMILRTCGISSASLRTWESQLQDLCVQSQALTTWQADTGTALGQLWQQAQDVMGSAAAVVGNADTAWSQFKDADDAVKGAYSNGNYQDSNDAAFVMQVMQDYNHTSLAWPNIQAAAACIHEQFWDFCQSIGTDFAYRFRAMSQQAGVVSNYFEGVQSLVRELQNDSADVTLPKDVSDAVAKAAPLMKQLNELAGQIAALFSQASTWDGRVTNAMSADPPDWQTLLDADAWVRTAQQPFIDAPNSANELASSIHQLLDGPAQQMHDYLIQHPELVGQGRAKAPAKASTGKVIAGVGVVGVLALLVKKGIIFG